MRHCPHSPPLDAHVRAAWQTQLVSAGTMPGLLPTLVRRQPELLPGFAASYTQLRALPRRVRRALQRQWRLPLAGVALMLTLGQNPGLAATIPVNADCTLVDAITAANTDTATGGCSAGSGADTIVLPAGSTHTLTSVNNDTYGPTGLPVISSVITIAGLGSTIARDSTAPDFRILVVSNMGELTLQETTVSGGRSFLVDGGLVENFGGGVANFDGTLTVTNSTISGNTTRVNGGGVSSYFSGILTITNSTIAGNVGGGMLNNRFSTGIVTNSTIAGNVGGNGGIANFGTLTVTNSTISGNTTNSIGGGMLNGYGGTLTLVRTLIAGNAASTGPEIFNFVPYATLLANNYNLFGIDGTAGVVGFSPGTTDMVPPRRCPALRYPPAHLGLQWWADPDPCPRPG